MPCTNPLKAYVSSHTHPSGKPKFVFTPEKSIDGKVMYLPCGSCDSCHAFESGIKGWRSELEASQYEDNNTFVTLSYATEHLPKDLSLHHKHWQEYIRAVRDYERNQAKKENREPSAIRFAMCGEYGKATAANNLIARPHFHGLLFNYKFTDEQEEGVNDLGQLLYSSEICERLWGRGNIIIGEVEKGSANYIARHNEKHKSKEDRILIDANGKRYMWIWNSLTGKRNRVKPEYGKASNRPGIGKSWYDEHKKDIYETVPKGLISCGHYADFPSTKAVPHYRMPGRYFDKLFESEEPEKMALIKEQRIKQAQAQAADNTAERLETKAELAAIARKRKEKVKL